MNTSIPTNKMSNNNTEQLDSYSLLITSKYFESTQDFINAICVCKKFKETTEKLRFNPIPITSMKLFPNIQTQYLYSEDDTKIEEIENHEIWYIINYDQYLKFDQDNIKCHHIQYTETNRSKYGDIIPENVTMLGYSCYGYGYFRWDACKISDIASITIPHHVTSIDKECFGRCNNLTKIKFPEVIQSIGDQSFFGCRSLTSICFPNSVTYIGGETFYDCTFLQSITLPVTLESLKNRLFYSCSSLKDIELPSTLSSIGDYCFYCCTSLKSISLPSTLKKIGQYGFSECGIQSLVLPNSITTIGINCFLKCSILTDLNLDLNANTISFEVSRSDSIFFKQFDITCINVTLTQDDVSSITYENKIGIDLKEYTIPNGIKSISENAFNNYYKLQSITIPTTVTSLGDECFSNCLSLTSIKIPTSVKSIGRHCFSQCKSLQSITLSNNVQSIGDYCFNDCTSLTSVKLPQHLQPNKTWFQNCKNLKISSSKECVVC